MANKTINIYINNEWNSSTNATIFLGQAIQTWLNSYRTNAKLRRQYPEIRTIEAVFSNNNQIKATNQIGI